MATRRIAVLVRERQAEALRMSLGLLLLGDAVDVYVLERRLEPTDDIRVHLEAMREFEVPLFTDHPGNEGMECLAPDALARRLPGYDHVLAY